MWFPLQRIPVKSARWPGLALLLALTFWLGAKAGGDGLLYNKYVAPYGIVSLELAGNDQSASNIMSFWDRWGGRKIARDSLRYDYFFLAFYSTTIALACTMAAEVFYRRAAKVSRFRSRNQAQQSISRPNNWLTLGKLGIALAWAQWVAALSDALENVGLTHLLSGSLTSSSGWVRWSHLVWWCAVSKLTLVFLGIAYASAGALVWAISSVKPKLRFSTPEAKVD